MIRSGEVERKKINLFFYLSVFILCTVAVSILNKLRYLITLGKKNERKYYYMD